MSSKESRITKDNRTPWVSRLLVSSLVSTAMVLGVGAAWAGGDGHGYKHDPKSKLERMTKKLDLTQEQQEKILPILSERLHLLRAALGMPSASLELS